ncbi:MAG TPA: hypothetical protein VNN73_05525 [Blastocatellia bacterium]|nr:hypothetical protein [Blastocatellia bacterium]
MKRTLQMIVASLALLFTAGIAAAQQNDSTRSPLVRLLQSKGIITEQEAASVSAASTPVEAERLLAKLLLSKGVITQQEYDQTELALGASSTPSASPKGTAVPAAASSSNPAAERAVTADLRTNQPATATDASASQTRTAGEPVRWSDLIGEGNRFKFYGFLRLDMNIDSQRPNVGQAPLFITSEDPRIGKPDAGNFSMHPRLTRFGVDYTGPTLGDLGDAKLTGKLELDFFNGGSESRQIIRIRHAYLKMGWKDFSLLGGQTWDIFSPLFPTVNTVNLMWNAGNVGDRRPQFRFAYEPKVGGGQFSLIGGVGLTGAIDALDLDANGFRDGEESGRPDVQARVGVSHPLWVKGQSASIGASGFYGWLNTTRPVTPAARTSFRSQIVNIDYTLPIVSRVSLRGEGWWGRNMSDTRGGAGQGINPVTGRDIRGRGGWSELSIKASKYWSLHPGFSTDDPLDQDVPVGGRTRNASFYFGNRITPSGAFTIGLDYFRWKTNYKGFLRGIDNRVDIFFQYSF